MKFRKNLNQIYICKLYIIMINGLKPIANKKQLLD